jgi:tetratricopeptide (TPR) repeat protein
MKLIFKRRFILVAVLLMLSFGNLYAQLETKDLTAADSLLNVGQFEKAIILFNDLIKTYGEKGKYLTGRGFAYTQLKDLQKGKADYQKALSLNAQCSKCIANLGMIELDAENYNEALSLFEQYIKLEPAKAMGYVKKGEVEFQLGKYNEAIIDLNKGLQIDVNSPYILLWLSMTKLAQGDAKAGLDLINKSIQYQPEVEYAYFIRAKCYIQLQQYQPAWNDLASCLRKNPKFSEYHTYAGIALSQLNQPNKAMQAFNESIRLNADSYLPYLHRSYLQYNAGNFEKACADKLKAKELLAKNPPDVLTAKQIDNEIDSYCNNSRIGYYISMGETLFNLGNFDRSRSVFDEGLSKFKNDPILLNGRGNTSIAAGNFKEAMQFYNTCIQNISQLNPQLLVTDQNPVAKTATAFFNAQLYNSIAFAQANLLHFDTAVINLNKAIDLLYSDPAIHDQPFILSDYLAKRSMFNTIQKKYKEADKDIDEALKVDPKNATAFLNRATNLISRNTIENKKATDLKPLFNPGSALNASYITTPIKDWNREEIIAAVKDCDAAISYEPGNANAYLTRAQANIILKKTNYCDDIVKAKSLNSRFDCVFSIPFFIIRFLLTFKL